MSRASLRPVKHEDRLSLVEHLDELRARLIICVAAFLVCFGVAFWQNDTLLHIMNRPLERTAFHGSSQDPFEKAAGYQQLTRAYLERSAKRYRELAVDASLSAAARASFTAQARDAAALAASTPKPSAKRPVT